MTTPPCAANRLPRKHSTRAEAILRPHAVLLLALLLALLLVTGCSEELADWSAIDTGIRHRYPEVPSLTTAQLATWLARADTVQPLLLDVRRPDEFAISHLAGALRGASVAEAVLHLAAAALDTPVVTYCSVGYRSAALAQQLRRQGFTNVTNLRGSLFRWANEGRPLWRDGEPVEVVHPYGWPWSGLLDAARHADVEALRRAAESGTAARDPVATD